MEISQIPFHLPFICMQVCGHVLPYVIQIENVYPKRLSNVNRDNEYERIYNTNFNNAFQYITWTYSSYVVSLKILIQKHISLIKLYSVVSFNIYYSYFFIQQSCYFIFCSLLFRCPVSAHLEIKKRQNSRHPVLTR